MGKVRISIFRRLIDLLQDGDIITLSCQEHELAGGFLVSFSLVRELWKDSDIVRRFTFTKPGQEFSFLVESKHLPVNGVLKIRGDAVWRIRNNEILNEVYLISPSSRISSEEDKILVHLNGRLVE